MKSSEMLRTSSCLLRFGTPLNRCHLGVPKDKPKIGGGAQCHAHPTSRLRFQLKVPSFCHLLIDRIIDSANNRSYFFKGSFVSDGKKARTNTRRVEKRSQGVNTSIFAEKFIQLVGIAHSNFFRGASQYYQFYHRIQSKLNCPSGICRIGGTALGLSVDR